MRLLLPCILLAVLSVVEMASAQSTYQQPTGTTKELLDLPLSEGQAVIWHLYHSGFVVRTKSQVMIFDYVPVPEAEAGLMQLASGFIDPEEFVGRRVVVFISHEHHDHYYQPSLQWHKIIDDIHYIVSPEVFVSGEYHETMASQLTTLAHDADTTVAGIAIRTIKSTDSGVAFLIETDGLSIYHSGDHAWWNWNNEPKTVHVYIDRYLGRLKGKTIDIALQVCDQRLRDSGWGGYMAFMSAFQPSLGIPMHTRGDYAAIAEAAEIVKREGIGVPTWVYRGRGDVIMFDKSTVGSD